MRGRDVLEPAFEQYAVPRDFLKFPIKKNGVCGVATNDADYITQIKETLPDGKRKQIWSCPIYDVWTHMIMRGYSQKCKDARPTYQNVIVCDEWHLFSNFRNWWVENNVRGWQLDKDILHKENLVYSPENCVYVPNYINTLLVDRSAARGEYPLGVCFDKHKNRFKSQVWLNGKQKHLGYFTFSQETHKAWQIGKIEAIKESIDKYIEEANSLGVFDVRIVGALNDRISMLEDDVANGRETLVLH